jgi:hypothetical protein
LKGIKTKKEMARSAEQPNTFLWVLRGLTSVFLLGYLSTIYLAVFISNLYPSGNLAEDLIAAGLLLVFGLGYYLMWIRKEVLAGILFILWYAALWPMDLLAGEDLFKDAPTFGILMLFLGILFLVYRAGVWLQVKKISGGSGGQS